MNELFWLFVAIYAAMWIVALHFIWRSYRVGIKNDLRLIKGLDGQPLKGRHHLVRPFALTEFFTGIAVIAFLVAVPIFALPMRIWPAFILIIGMSRQLQIIKLAREK